MVSPPLIHLLLANTFFVDADACLQCTTRGLPCVTEGRKKACTNCRRARKKCRREAEGDESLLAGWLERVLAQMEELRQQQMEIEERNTQRWRKLTRRLEQWEERNRRRSQEREDRGEGPSNRPLN